MANGPMGGFMPTPAAPAQPPQVKLDTTADSRGTFNSFLRSMNGATSLNPPSMAPLQGVIADPLAPALSNIDIFNQPVQNFELGGFAGDTSGTFSVDEDTGEVTDDFSIGGGGFGGTGGTEEEFQQALDDERSTDFTSPATDIFSDDPAFVDRRGVNVGLENRGKFTSGVVPNLRGERFARFENVPLAMRGIARDFRSKIRGAEDKNQDLTVGDYFNKFNPSDDNKNRLSEFESLTGKKAGDKLNIGDMQNIMNIQAKYEAGIRNVAPSVQKAILNTVDIEDDKKVESILGDLDLGKSLLTEPKDFLEIEANPRIGSPAMAGLPTVTSRFNQTQPKSEIEVLRDAVANTIKQVTEPLSDTEKALQQNQQDLIAQRGRALGPITFSDDLANFAQGERSRGFEDSRVGDDFDTALDIVDQREKNALRDQLLGLGQTAEKDKMVREMNAIDRETAGRASDFPTITTSNVPEDYEENVGLPFSDKRMADIERLPYNLSVGQTAPGQRSRFYWIRKVHRSLTFFEGLGIPGPH